MYDSVPTWKCDNSVYLYISCFCINNRSVILIDRKIYPEPYISLFAASALQTEYILKVIPGWLVDIRYNVYHDKQKDLFEERKF